MNFPHELVDAVLRAENVRRFRVLLLFLLLSLLGLGRFWVCLLLFFLKSLLLLLLSFALRSQLRLLFDFLGRLLPLGLEEEVDYCALHYGVTKDALSPRLGATREW